VPNTVRCRRVVLDLLFPASNDCNPELNRTANEAYQKKQASSGAQLAQIRTSASSEHRVYMT
jgi:hypothetical protein